MWGGQVPPNGRNQDVTVPAQKIIVLDTDIDLGGLTIMGTLRCANKDIKIRARWVMVHGLLECGTPDRPFTKRLEVTLTGNNPSEDIMGMGTKFLGTMGGGQLWLHGENRTAWARLNKTAQPGQTTLELDAAPNWRTGDKIIVTSTSALETETEVRTISGVNGLTITLSAPLQYRHFGEQQNYTNGKGINWTADTRASVGLLSRNIVIRGDETSKLSQFGGHMMAMSGSPAYVSGVELENLGQVGRTGRYPFHWHMAGDVGDQYITNSSIHDSFNRCVTVHGSQNALVKDNVCFNQIGHAMFLEDGVETGNTFDRNLVVNTIRPENGKAIIPSDLFMGVAAKGPAAFWISNGDNTITNNVVAGSQGSAYWYHTEDKPTGASSNLPQYANVNPMTSRFGKFENNTVHSSRMAFSSCTNEGGPVGYSPPNQAVYRNFTVFYGGTGAIWPCWGNQLFTDMKVLDTGFETCSHDGACPAFVAPSEVKVSRSLFVSNSKLALTPKHRAALGLYDFGVDFTDTHFVNYSAGYADSAVATSLGGTNNRTDNTLQRVTFQNSDRFLKLLPVKLDGRDHIGPNQWGSVIHDLDGSMGMGPGSMVANHPMAVDPQCRPELFADARFCPGLGWGMFHIFFGRYDITLPEITHGRSDLSTRYRDRPEGMPWYQAQVSLSHNRYHYIFDMASTGTMGNEFELQLFYAPKLGETLTLELTGLPGQPRVDHGEYRQVGSLAELKSSTGKTWARMGGSIYVKMVTRGEPWSAHDFVKVKW